MIEHITLGLLALQVVWLQYSLWHLKTIHYQLIDEVLRGEDGGLRYVQSGKGR